MPSRLFLHLNGFWESANFFRSSVRMIPMAALDCLSLESVAKTDRGKAGLLLKLSVPHAGNARRPLAGRIFLQQQSAATHTPKRHQPAGGTVPSCKGFVVRPTSHPSHKGPAPPACVEEQWLKGPVEEENGSVWVPPGITVG